MKVFKWLVLLVMSVGLMACAVQQDPSKGGFIDGVLGILTDSYASRIDERERNLATTKQEQKDFLTEQTDLTITSVETKAEVAALKGEFDNLSKQNNLLSAKIDNIKATTTEMEAEKNRLKNRVKSLEEEIKRAESSVSSSSTDLKDAEAKEKKLQQEIQKLEKDIKLLEPL
jgi:chromosome segregation ATPase